MPSGWQESVAQHKQRSRNRIAQTALGLAVERGLAALTMGAIAERAQVSRATAYNYFPDVEHALLYAVEIEVASFAEAVTAELAGADGPTQRLRAFLGAQVGYFADPRRQSAALQFRSAGLSPTVRERMREHTARLEAVLVEILASGRDSGVFRPDIEPRRTAELILQLLTGVREQVLREDAPADLLVAELVALVERGLSLR